MEELIRLQRKAKAHRNVWATKLSQDLFNGRKKADILLLHEGEGR